jgi:transposase-like protein
MSSKRYTEKFKVEVVKQVTERSYPVAEVANRIGVSQHSLYTTRVSSGNCSHYDQQRTAGRPKRPVVELLVRDSYQLKADISMVKTPKRGDIYFWA